MSANTEVGDLVPKLGRSEHSGQCLKRLMTEMLQVDGDGPKRWEMQSCWNAKRVWRLAADPAWTCAVQLPGKQMGVLKVGKPYSGKSDCMLFIRLKRHVWNEVAERRNLRITDSSHMFRRMVTNEQDAWEILRGARAVLPEKGQVHDPQVLSLVCKMGNEAFLDTFMLDYRMGKAPTKSGRFMIFAMPPLPVGFEQCLCLLGHSSTYEGNTASIDTERWGNLPGRSVDGRLIDQFTSAQNEYKDIFVKNNPLAKILPLLTTPHHKAIMEKAVLLFGATAGDADALVAAQVWPKKPPPPAASSTSDEDEDEDEDDADDDATPSTESSAPKSGPATKTATTTTTTATTSAAAPAPAKKKAATAAATTVQKKRKPADSDASDSSDADDDDDDDSDDPEADSEESDSDSSESDGSENVESGSEADDSSSSSSSSGSPPPSPKHKPKKAKTTASKDNDADDTGVALQTLMNKSIADTIRDMARPLCERMKRLEREHGFTLGESHLEDLKANVRLLEVEAPVPAVLAGAAAKIAMILADVHADRFRDDPVTVSRAEGTRVHALATQAHNYINTTHLNVATSIEQMRSLLTRFEELRQDGDAVMRAVGGGGFFAGAPEA